MATLYVELHTLPQKRSRRSTNTRAVVLKQLLSSDPEVRRNLGRAPDAYSKWKPALGSTAILPESKLVLGRLRKVRRLVQASHYARLVAPSQILTLLGSIGEALRSRMTFAIDSKSARGR